MHSRATHDIDQFNRGTADIEQHLLGALAATEALDAAALMDQKTFNFFVHCGLTSKIGWRSTMINAFHELLVYDARHLFYINTHASFPWVVFDIFKSSCCPECDSSMSPSLSLLSCFCGDKGLAPLEVKLEVNVEAKWDIHSLAELPAL
jgi:hypothetical protein